MESDNCTDQPRVTFYVILYTTSVIIIALLPIHDPTLSHQIFVEQAFIWHSLCLVIYI